MAVWAILAGPLLMSNDLRNIRKESRDLLLNKNLIAINQDPLGIAGIQVTVSQDFFPVGGGGGSRFEIACFVFSMLS